MKKKTKIILISIVIMLLLFAFALFIFTNKGYKVIIVENGFEFGLEFNKKTYKLDDKVKVKGYVKNISSSSRLYQFPDTCTQYYQVKLLFGSDIRELYRFKSDRSLAYNCTPAFRDFWIKPNEVIKVEEVLLPKGYKGDLDSLNKKDLRVVVTFGVINENIEFEKTIPFED